MDMRYSIYEELLPKAMGPKGQRTYLNILQSALRCYAVHGIEGTTFEKIALESGVTRPMVLRYFADYDILFEAAIKYIRIQMQEHVIEQMKNSTTTSEQFESYVRATLDWVAKFPTHAQFWMYFFFQCSRLPRFRKLNTELVVMGERRVLSFLEGIDTFSTAKQKRIKAKAMHSMLAGVTVSLITEVKTSTLTELAKSLPTLLCDLAKADFLIS